MEKYRWKIIAIIFFSLFILETSYLGLSFYYYFSELKKTNICYYDFCGEYPQALYESGVCSCYDYDVFGKLVVSKQEYMK